MGAHKRYISNEQIIKIYTEGGATSVIDWYTKGVDALITEIGIASELGEIIDDAEWQSWDPIDLANVIQKKIHDILGLEDIQK